MDDTIRSTSSMTDEFLEDISLQKKEPFLHHNPIDLEQLINLISNKVLADLSHSISEQKPIESFQPPNPLFPIVEEEKKQEEQTVLIQNKHLPFLLKSSKSKLIRTKSKLINKSELKLDKKISTQQELPLKEGIFSIDSRSEEQIFDLCSILEKRKLDLPQEIEKQICHLAKLIALSSAKDKTSNLGKLLYLVSSSSLEELKQVKIKSCEQLVKWIGLKFDEKIGLEWIRFQKLKKQLSLSMFKDPATTLRHHYSIFLSQILLSENGTINFGVIEPLLQLCPPDKIIQISNGDPLFSMLKVLKENSAFRSQFASLNLPNEINTASAAIIHASLSIGISEKISPLEAKRSILSALLSHLRQGSDGSCFAMPLAIFLLLKYPSLCLDDFASLMKKNKLRRKFNQILRDFPFILNGSTNDLDKHVINAEGCFSDLKNNKLKIYNDPVILSLCQFLGIAAAKETILQILSEHRLEFQKGAPLSIFIQKLILEAKKLPIHSQHGIGELYQQSLLMLQAQTTHPLLTAWINTIANMAEPDETGMVRSTVIRSILQTLKSEMHDCISSSEKLELALKKIKEELSNRIQLQYDPGVQMHEKSSDQRSSSGAFVMYDTHYSEETEKWTRIDNPKAFNLFISGLLDIEEKQENGLKNLWKHLQKYALTEKFLKKCLCEYYHKNQQFPHPLKQHAQMSYTPWITKSGNSFSKVVQVYFENFVSSNSELYSAENAKDLFLKITSISNTLQPPEEDHVLIPVRIPKVHAFNLLISHPSMAPVIKSKKKEEWIDKQLILPCKLLSEKKVPEECYETFLAQIKKEMVPQEMLLQLKNSPLNHPYKPMKLRELREFALSALNELFKKKKVIQGELCSQLDILLIENLPKEWQAQIYSKAIHFADTNWSDGVHDIHLCLIINPGKGELDIVASYDNGQKFFPLNGDHWIQGKKWEFFTEIDPSAKKSLLNKGVKKRN